MIDESNWWDRLACSRVKKSTKVTRTCFLLINSFLLITQLLCFFAKTKSKKKSKTHCAKILCEINCVTVFFFASSRASQKKSTTVWKF